MVAATEKPPERALSIVPPQASMFDHELANDTIYGLVEAKFRLEKAARAYAQAQKQLRENVKTLAVEMELKDGERLCIRKAKATEKDVPFVIELKARAGGGHAVAVWNSMGIGRISKLKS